MSVRTVVLDQVKLVAELHQKSLAPLTDTLPLLDSGLDSLCIANIMAGLEDKLGFDPFGNTITLPRTLGEFIDLYENGVRASIDERTKDGLPGGAPGANDRTTTAVECAANHLGKISKSLASIAASLEKLASKP
jgi:acyl carrier protein